MVEVGCDLAVVGCGLGFNVVEVPSGAVLVAGANDLVLVGCGCSLGRVDSVDYFLNDSSNHCYRAMETFNMSCHIILIEFLVAKWTLDVQLRSVYLDVSSVIAGFCKSL